MLFIVLIVVQQSCTIPHLLHDDTPVIGYLDAFQDNTLELAKDGFFDALEKEGYSEGKKTLQVIYRNAEGMESLLLPAIQYMESQNVLLIATCPSITTLIAYKNTVNIPIFANISSSPQGLGLKSDTLTDSIHFKMFVGTVATNRYIDSSMAIISQCVQPKKGILKIGVLYDQSEIQSLNALATIRTYCLNNNINLVNIPVSNTNEVQIALENLIHQDIDLYFALPDNTIFSTFATIKKTCNQFHVPIFTSEGGLVRRGAVAAFGPNFYDWGYQTGLQAASFLKTRDINKIHWQLVSKLTKIYNPNEAAKFGYKFDDSFRPIVE